MILFACRPSPGILSLVPIVGPSMRPSGRYRKVITNIGTSRRCYIAVVETIAQTKKLIRCPIPDDHIDARRTALFMARSILCEVRDGRRGC